MFSKKYFNLWGLKEPIERKVLFLVFMLILLVGTFIGIDMIRQKVTHKMRVDLENQSARRNLGKIVLEKLLIIEKDFILLVSAEDERDIEIIHGHIQDATNEIKKILTILQNGGRYTNVLPMNFENMDEALETINFQSHGTSSYVMEVIDLTPKIIDIEQHANDLKSASFERLNDRKKMSSVKHYSAIGLLRKKMDATITRSRETANKINYDTSLKINGLETSIAEVVHAYEIIRDTVAVVVFIIGVILCLNTLRQIRYIISERANYAKKLKEANASIYQLVESLPVGIAVINTDCTLRQVNQSALDMLGVEKADQIIGKNCHDIFCSATKENCPLSSNLLMPYGNEAELITQSGLRMPVIKRAVTLRLDNTEVVLEAFVDISDRVKAEQDLIEKQNYINTILASATVGIIVVDAKDHIIVEANPTALSIIGAPKDLVIGSECQKWVCASQKGYCPITDGGKEVHNHECILQNYEGQDTPIVKNVSKTLLNGRPYLVESFLNIAPLKEAEAHVRRLNEELELRVIERTNQLQARNDELKNALTELKHAQDRLLQSEKMASIGQLAAGVAHEINNPVGFVKSNLNSMDGYRMDLMRLIKAYEALCEDAVHVQTSKIDISHHIRTIEDIREDIDMVFIQQDFGEVLKESMEGINRVANIVADLKNFAHMDNDKLEWASLNDVIESALNIVWNELKYKAEVSKDLGILPEIKCYPQRLGQVFMNLFVNASQAIIGKQQGRIEVKTSVEHDHVMVRISDTGCGIPQENLNKIYDPFFTTKKVGEGTGLGLNVVYNIIKSHQGHVDVKSELGKGTVFLIQLPIELDDE
ncbi:MAG: PAS domain-containing protein [Proteobacteria bacterium]|nr:PAS domain-containing protein [Pseudomonadota bacterium]